MFDDLPALAALKPSDLRDELDRFLSTDPEYVQDVLSWWFERRHTFPRLSRMARDYLSIPGV
jgi:hAT family C-terminal dimerisation region